MVLIEVDYWKLTVIGGLNTATKRLFLKIDEFDFEIESKSFSNWVLWNEMNPLSIFPIIKKINNQNLDYL